MTTTRMFAAIRSACLIAGCVIAASPLIASAQSTHRDSGGKSSRESYGSLHYGPLARYDSLTERVDRKNAKAHEYERESPTLREWKRRQHDEPIDDDDGDE